MSASHQYEVKASWAGGLEGYGRFLTPAFESVFSAPKNLRGSGLGTNPEELLLAAAATCFLITLGAVLSRAGVTLESIQMKSELVLATEGALKVQAIHHRPEIEIAGDGAENQVDRVREAVKKAEAFCLVATALKGNVEIRVSPEILVEGT